jgi:hypothetical protein
MKIPATELPVDEGLLKEKLSIERHPISQNLRYAWMRNLMIEL